MRHILPVILSLFVFACIKKDNSTDQFVGNVEIDSTNTVKTVAVGQDIVSFVRLVRPSVSGDMTFLGIEKIEKPSRTYTIRAKALYKPWKQQISLPVYFTWDTTLTINAKVTGIYILNFYNSNSLFKSDTVDVY